MTSPRQVNKAIETLGVKGQIVRAKEGYYYFIGDLFDVVPSIYSNSLRGYTTQQVIIHIFKGSIQYIKDHINQSAQLTQLKGYHEK